MEALDAAAQGERQQSSTILIVDTNTHNTSLLKRRLAIFGYDVLIASSAKEGAAMMKENPIDVVFLALDLPVISGFQMLRSIKKRDEYKNVPIIMTSENDDLEKVVKCIEAGAEDYMTYPMNHTILKARLRNCIHKKTSHDKEIAYIAQIENSQRQISAQEKMVSIGTLATSISQELKNPLNFVINFAESSAIACEKCLSMLQQHLSKNKMYPDLYETLCDFQRNTNKIIEYGKSADQIVRFMIDQSTISVGGMHPGNINRVIEESIKRVDIKFKALSQDIASMINTSLDSSIKHIPIVVPDLCRVLENLICNSIEAIQKRMLDENITGNVTITTIDDEDYVRIIVSDNGCGMSAGVQSKMFEPFFTTKNSSNTNNSIGLGLSSVKRIIINEHNGDIHVSSEENKFTTIQLTISKHNAEPSNNAPAQAIGAKMA